MRSEKGFTLVEVLVGLVLLAVVGVAILSGMNTIFKSNYVSNTQTTGVSIAQTQLEFIASDNVTTCWDPTDKVGYYPITTIPSGYTVWTLPRGTNSDGTGNPVECTLNSKGGLVGIPWDDQTGIGHNIAISMTNSTEYNIQKVTVIIKKDNKVVTTISAFKVR
jgi:prepilin-type N-terminal cleavage/methylation domain-containing protein